MKNCVVPDSQCWLSESDNPKRKYPHTWEVATTPSGHLAGINTGRANSLVRDAIGAGVITELQGYVQVRSEVRYGSEKSRIDFLLEDGERQCYVEVKSVTLMEQPGQGLFPDAVSERGSKHLRELMAVARNGHRAVLLFCVQHTGIEWVAPADVIDPVYGRTLRDAMGAGVEVLAYQAVIQPDNSRIFLRDSLPVRLP
jgi:sugar fermentation stimulation protein A